MGDHALTKYIHFERKEGITNTTNQHVININLRYGCFYKLLRSLDLLPCLDNKSMYDLMEVISK